MENYDDFFNNARLYTSVHARPTPAQAKLIEQHNAIHSKGEEKKMEEDDQEIGREATGGVLSQLTNSFLPTTSIEGKGENFSMDGMPAVKSAMGANNGAIKKAPAAADPKKKWMRRI